MVYLQLLAGLRPRLFFSDIFTHEDGVGYHAILAGSLLFLMIDVTWYMEGDRSGIVEGPEEAHRYVV